MADGLTGYLFAADISGYTAYLNESELEHARGTLTELLELLVDRTRPPLVVSRLEGDAVVAYGLQDGFIGGQTFVELVESMYVDFRRAIDLMVLNNVCRCNACANVSSLDLKFFVHSGNFLLQPLAGYVELIGPDVNLIHRLMKNQVIAETGIFAYCLYTEAAREHLGLTEFSDLIPHSESVADFGEVRAWVQDMTPAYEKRKGDDKVEIFPEEVIFDLETEVNFPPPVLWDYLASEHFRNILFGSDRQQTLGRQEGRTAKGTSFQCYHGDQILPKVVLEWSPFSRFVTQDTMGTPLNGTFIVVTQLKETETGTLIHRTGGQLRASRSTTIAMKLGVRKGIAKRQQALFEEFIRAATEDWNTSNSLLPTRT